MGLCCPLFPSWDVLPLVPFRWKYLRQGPQASTIISDSWQAFPKAFYAKESEASFQSALSFFHKFAISCQLLNL